MRAVPDKRLPSSSRCRTRRVRVHFPTLQSELGMSTIPHTGTVTFTPSISWCTNAMVLEFLGIDVATANDTAYITTCVAAANSYIFRKRREAGYTDSQSVVPDASVKLGTILYASTLYRERGSADSFASFDAMSSIPIPSTMGRIMALIGCGRPQVA